MLEYKLKTLLFELYLSLNALHHCVGYKTDTFNWRHFEIGARQNRVPVDLARPAFTTRTTSLRPSSPSAACAGLLPNSLRSRRGEFDPQSEQTSLQTRDFYLLEDLMYLPYFLLDKQIR